MKLVNIDWLEIFCNENCHVLDTEYFSSCGYSVKQREYGTPQYREMFVLYDNDLPIMEIRRNPYSLKMHGGIFNVGDCHLRLPNRMCYDKDPINFFRKFLLSHDYVLKSISRIDICLDFQTFDNGESPEQFVSKYMCGILSKLNQCNIAAHGKDRWTERHWNSLKWGSEKSPITTKLYNKSLELKETHAKNYIVMQWEYAHFNMTKDVWRLEFSISSHVKGYVNLETGHVIESKLTTYDTKEKLLIRHLSLQSIYFDIRIVSRSKSGQLIRKSRCPRYNAFNKADLKVYKPINLVQMKDPDRTDKMLLKRLKEMYDKSCDDDKRKSIRDVIMLIADNRLFSDIQYYKLISPILATAVQ